MTQLPHASSRGLPLQEDLTLPPVIEDRHALYNAAVSVAVTFCGGALYLCINDLRTTILNYRKDIDRCIRVKEA